MSSSSRGHGQHRTSCVGCRKADRTFVNLLSPTDPRSRSIRLYVNGPLTNCRHPFPCSIITGLKHQGHPYINLDPVHRPPTWGIGAQKPHQGDFFRKPRTTYVRQNFISHLSAPLFHQLHIPLNQLTTPSPHAREGQKWRRWADGCDGKRANLTLDRRSPMLLRGSRPQKASAQSLRMSGQSHDLCERPIFGFYPLGILPRCGRFKKTESRSIYLVYRIRSQAKFNET